MRIAMRVLPRLRHYSAALAAGILATGIGCSERSLVQPASSPVGMTATANQSGSVSNVGWLAPLGTASALGAQFDPNAVTAVEICPWTGTVCSGSPIARFVVNAVSPTLPLIINTSSGDYEASWNLLDPTLTTRKTYRIRALNGTSEVGAISVDAIRGRWALTRSDG